MTPLPWLPLRDLNERDRVAFHRDLDAVLDSGRLLLGSRLEEFESAFASVAGTAFCRGTASGLDAIALMLLAAGFPAGSEILLPANTFVASALGVLRAGLVPVPVDIDPATGNLDPRLLAGSISERTRAVLVVHLHGIPQDMDTLGEAASALGLEIFEDAAQAHGATWKGRPCGSFGRAAAFSFYPGKNLGALGDAGAVTTSDPTLARAVELWRNYGSPEKYRHDLPGWNSRLDELQAAFLATKLPRLEADNARRREIAAILRDGIRHPDVHLPEPPAGADPCWHLFPVLCPDRDRLRRHLDAQGIETLVHYPVPLHRQPCLSSLARQTLPEAERWCASTLSLPCHPLSTPEDARRIASAVNGF